MTATRIQKALKWAEGSGIKHAVVLAAAYRGMHTHLATAWESRDRMAEECTRQRKMVEKLEGAR